jgi:hypothetical protein
MKQRSKSEWCSEEALEILRKELLPGFLERTGMLTRHGKIAAAKYRLVPTESPRVGAARSAARKSTDAAS